MFERGKERRIPYAYHIPAFSNNVTTTMLLVHAAKCKGVLPSLSR